MQNAYVLTGCFKSPNLIELDEMVNLSLQKVRIIIEPIEISFNKESLMKTMKEINASQEKRNFAPPSREEVDSYIHNLKEEWD